MNVDINKLKSEIKSLKILHKYTTNHILIKCKIIDFLNLKITNWEFNRPPDTIRANAIAKYVYTKKPELDWLFYAIYDNKEGCLNIIDGIHRYTALTIINKENHKEIDLLDLNIYGYNGNAKWLYETYILISLRFNTTIGEQIDLFQTLNKSNPVPDLYINNNDESKRIIIEEIVNTWMVKFINHFSHNAKSNIPNTNRDRFIELLDILYNKYKIDKTNINILYDKLYEMNEHIKKNIPIKISQNAIEKCNKSGCYLFLYKNDILEDKFMSI